MMDWSTEEKRDVFRHEAEYPELARLLRAKNKYDFENRENVEVQHG